MWRAERLIDTLSYRAVMSKFALSGEAIDSLLVKDSSDLPEGHEGSGNANPQHLISQFVKTMGMHSMLEIRDMGIAAVVDLKRGPIVAQNLATCYCIVLVCKTTERAVLCHVPDGFAGRLTSSKSSSWGNPAFEHLVRTLRAQVVEGTEATTHALVIGGQVSDTIDGHFGVKIFIIAFFTWHLSKAAREELARETDEKKIVAKLRQTKGIDNFEDWKGRAANIDFLPVLLNGRMWKATNALIHEGVDGIKELFSEGREWATEAYPVRKDGKLTEIGKFIMEAGGKNLEGLLRDLQDAGRVMRGWLDKMSGINLVKHTHLNERNRDMHTTTVAVIKESQPVVYIWRVPEKADKSLKIELEGRTKHLQLRDNGSIVFPRTQLVSFGATLLERMNELKHMGIFLWGADGKLRLVTTKKQDESFLNHVGKKYEDSSSLKLHESHPDVGEPIVDD